MIDLQNPIPINALAPLLEHFWQLSGQKIRLLLKEYDESQGSPVFTIRGRYTSRGWTEWTQGFQFGSALLQFDATGDEFFLEYGRRETIARMAPHVSHFGVHDHGFNNVSTYGNLHRLMAEGKIPADRWEQATYEMALKQSACIQARRWTPLPHGHGYIYSFNGPHSLFVDTIRSCRAVLYGHYLGHFFQEENDRQVNLAGRALRHALATAKYNIFYGQGRDAYDVRGRTAHECVFNITDGAFRCPNSQQGYSGFTTWTRGLSWALLGFAEQLEVLPLLDDAVFADLGGRTEVERRFLEAACATADFYLENTPSCGIPYWDTGAPGLVHLGDYLHRPAEPYNDYEPVDSSAAAICAQGYYRLAGYLQQQPAAASRETAVRYRLAALKIAHTLLQPPYLSENPQHQGLLLHTIYHRPNGWDHVPEGAKIPCGEACMWGDYHLRELALCLQREIQGLPPYRYANAFLPRS